MVGFYIPSKELKEDIMEKRKLNIGFTKSGRGSITSRVVLPISWIKEMNISQEDREVFVYKVGNEIIISKFENDLKFAKLEIDYTIEEKGYILLDDDIEELWKYCYDRYNSINNFDNSIYGSDKVYFYDKKYNFSSVEELEKYFGIEGGI